MPAIAVALFSRQGAAGEHSFFATAVRQGYFVSPCPDGFLLVIGVIPSPSHDPQKLASQFSELRSFFSHRTIGHCSREQYAGGQCVRKYYYANVEAKANCHPPTPEKLALGFDRFPHRGQAVDFGDLPTEEDVLSVAAA